MRSRFLRPALAILLAGAAALAPVRADAQRGRPSPAFATAVRARADSLVERGDSAAALEALERAVLRAPDDASLWHARGMLAWQMSREAHRNGVIGDTKQIRRLIAADTSLLRAHGLAPDSARFALDLGRFRLASNLSTTRYTALRYYERAVEAARRAADTLLLADALDAVGMVYWRRYEAVADRYLMPGLSGPSFESMVWDERELRAYVESRAMPVNGGLTGELDYGQASLAFAEAARLHPSHPGALRHLYMTLAERERWEELREAARGRLGSAPWDPSAWLARGLASHRLNDEGDAAAAFDSAATYLAERDLARLTRLSRLLRPASAAGRASDSARWAAADPERRARIERLYWAVSDPLAMTGANEYRLEFLSRVTYAELRWSVEEADLHGADSDRGDILVRYGPPDKVYNFTTPGGVSLVLWTYGESGFSFVFRQPPMYGTATFHDEYLGKAVAARQRMPVRWKNVDLLKHLDTIPVQVTRFRAVGDSTDVVVFARIPTDSLVRDLDVRQGAVDVEFRLYDEDARLLRRDSARTLVRPGETAEPSLRSWRQRVPRDAALWRVEALQPDGMRAARAAGAIVPDTARGFGLSDLLVASRVLPRAGAPAERWSDFNVAPGVGAFAPGEPLALLWETYGLAADSAGSRYRVAVTLEKARREGPLGLAASIVAGVGDAVGRSARGRGTITLSFDRSVAPRPAVVDYLALDLGAAPAGRYRLSVLVTDLVSTRTTRVERAIEIGGPPAAR